jgi:hypothetical protein
MTRAVPAPAAGADLAEQLFNAAFNKSRTPRSAEYKAGTRALLELRVHGIDLIYPYPSGTTQADAFYSGVDEGNVIWHAHRKALRMSAPDNGADGA